MSSLVIVQQVAIAAKGGIEAVVAAMGAHESIEEVQEQGCGALRNLSLNEDNEMAIAAKGGIGAVVRAMRAHRSSVGVQEQGCSFLHNIAWSDSGLRSQVIPLLLGWDYGGTAQ